MKVRKAIIPAAGFGSRMLPITKAIPKEMLPIVDKPALQYIIEEAALSGIEDILVVTSRGKVAIEDHFDRLPELENALDVPGKEELLESVLKTTKLANISYIRQQEINGLANAILMGRSFVGDEPFMVLYGDDVIISDYPVTKQLINAYEEFNLPSLGIQQVEERSISMYSSLKVKNLQDNIYLVDDMVEKPRFGEHFSLFAILGRCLLTPNIFEVIVNQPPGAGGEIQLTDAIRAIAKDVGCIGVDFVGKRYDIGNRLGYLKAQVELGLKHPDTAASFKEYIKALDLESF